MALVVKDRVKTTTSTAGTGPLAVSGFSADFQSFNVIGDGNTTYYTIVHNGFGEWEVGIGTYTAAGASLSRDTVLESSNNGALVDFSAGTKDVFVTYPAERAVFTDVTQTLTNKTISADDNTLSGIAASSFVLSNASGNIDGSAAQKVIPSGVVVGTTDTQTLTNKRIDPRVVAASGTSGNLTINGDTTDLYRAEGLTGAITFLQPSGTPVDGQKLMIRLEDDGTARAITWTTSAGAFRAVGITLPTTTVATKVTYVGCVRNATDGFWDAVATVTQA